jgi:ABC-2 type transport system ATP-binding protein
LLNQPILRFAQDDSDSPLRNSTQDGDELMQVLSTDHPILELRGARKVYRQTQRSERLRDVFGGLLRPRVRDVVALDSVDLTVHRGEVVAYAGPNGAGKSTTVKLLCGLLAPDAGTVRVLGLDPVSQRARCVGRIGVVFGQRTELWWDHPIAATYEWKRIIWDVPPDRFRRTLGFVREVLGLDEFFHATARELSLGQRMRADLGFALLHEPEVLFLDEPTLGLDVLAKRQVLAFIRELNRERRVTVLVTSHDMAELEQLAGRIVMVHRGRVTFDGPFDRLRRESHDHRRLVVHTTGDHAPVLAGAELVSSDRGQHAYTFDASQVQLSALLGEVAAHADVLDVETHRPPIGEVVAELYQRWQRKETA